MVHQIQFLPHGSTPPAATRDGRWRDWARRCLSIYAGWFWDHDVPLHVVEAWWCYVLGVRFALGADAEPHEARWEAMWVDFTDRRLSQEIDYMRQLNIRLHNVEGATKT